MNAPLRWTVVAAILRAQPAGSIAWLPPARVEHPRAAGMTLTMGLPVGQRADYRLDVGGGQELVVTEFAHGFEARLDRRPTVSDFESVLRNTPGTSVVGLIAAGALIGLALGRSKDSALVGATIGGVAALAGVGVANAQSAPRVAETASQMLTAMKTAVPVDVPAASGSRARPQSGRRRG
jgi:hypothetical protein